MPSISSNPLRVGSFTSSEIFRLLKPGQGKNKWSKDADTYIEECNMERRLMRSVEVQTDARPLSWGKAIEKRAFDVLPTDYTLCSDITLQHPTIPYWVGSPDATTEDAVIDLKAPMTLTSFCQMVDPGYDDKTDTWYDALTIEAVCAGHRDGNKFFWQIVSNAVLTGKKTGQLIIYVPYEDELEEIRQMIEGVPDFYWIHMADKEKLPYLIKGGHYQNVNIIEFRIMDRDVNLLTSRVIECGERLIPFHKPIQNG